MDWRRFRLICEFLFVLSAMAFGVLTAYFLFEGGGCSKCVLEKYIGLWEFIRRLIPL